MSIRPNRSWLRRRMELGAEGPSGSHCGRYRMGAAPTAGPGPQSCVPSWIGPKPSRGQLPSLPLNPLHRKTPLPEVAEKWGMLEDRQSV